MEKKTKTQCDFFSVFSLCFTMSCSDVLPYSSRLAICSLARRLTYSWSCWIQLSFSQSGCNLMTQPILLFTHMWEERRWSAFSLHQGSAKPYFSMGPRLTAFRCNEHNWNHNSALLFLNMERYPSIQSW